ncbi:LamG-like jellyroll fold domain-containing protein [Crateriforma conspicua]|uniref:LamG-like jellyroll fold domain-containing protein n=1 Tax=Crateriforma conspicua TaxID=2527996 RepID=UPI00118ACAE9|nr:LamG-like jellyroll fold domain-containing protein [Crateriforma conspicua]QDV62291.1 FecR protein [Crateriforma conspicua]
MSVDNDLIDRILEGEVSDEEAAELQSWLQDQENLERFALRAELHSGLRRSLQRQLIQKNALDASEDNHVAAFDSSQEKRQASVLQSRRTLGLGITGLVTAASILFAFVWPEAESVPKQKVAAAAKIVGNVSGTLMRSGSHWDDAKIPPGDYELQKGLLNLQFGGGVMVYIEAPAHFDAVSDKRVVLHSGRLSARVPPEGIGFTVETPAAEVVDFGTEFCVDAEAGASEVHVFDGLVRVHPGALQQRALSRSVDLQASQAVRIADGEVEPEGITIATDRFIRDFDEPKWNYARLVKRLKPLAIYRMPIRDRGLVSEPPEYSGIVVTGDGKRPPHARGVFVGGSLRIGADSTGRGGRVDSPPALGTGQFSLACFVYLEAPARGTMVATNLHDGQGNFSLSLNKLGRLQATVKNDDGDAVVDEATSPEPAESAPGTGLVTSSTTSDSVLPQETWRHVVVTADGERLQLYEDGTLVASTPCAAMAGSDSDATVWFGTDPKAIQVWDGRIDELALFDRALNENEIASLYRTAQEEIVRSR